MKNNLKRIVNISILSAITFIFTYLIKVPTIGTNGYINIGDVPILLFSFILSDPIYFLACGIGSMFCDILGGYVIYAPGTFIIKSLIYIFSFYFLKNKNKKIQYIIIAGAIGEITMAAGYFLYEYFLLGYNVGAIPSIFSNLVQGVVCNIVAITLYLVSPIKKYINRLMG